MVCEFCKLTCQQCIDYVDEFIADMAEAIMEMRQMGITSAHKPSSGKAIPPEPYVDLLMRQQPYIIPVLVQDLNLPH